MTLWHIEFGDGDDFFTISESKEEAISKMPEGQEMVRGVTKLDGLYQMILQQGRREVVEWVERFIDYLSYYEDWQKQKKKWGIK